MTRTFGHAHAVIFRAVILHRQKQRVCSTCACVHMGMCDTDSPKTRRSGAAFISLLEARGKGGGGGRKGVDGG